MSGNKLLVCLAHLLPGFLGVISDIACDAVQETETSEATEFLVGFSKFVARMKADRCEHSYLSITLVLTPR